MKQLSVFLENRQGRLDECLSALTDNDINVVSLSLADTTDFGMLLLIVSEPEKAREALKGRGFSANFSEVVGIRMPHVPGALQKALKVVAEQNINIEYMYALCTKTDEAAIVIKPSDIEKAQTVLKDNGYTLFTDGDLF